MNARLENLAEKIQQQSAVNNIDELVEKLSKAIRIENIPDKHAAMGELLSTDAGKKAVDKLLENNDPSKISDKESPEYYKASRFSREVRKTIQHIDPNYVVDKPVERITPATKVGETSNVVSFRGVNTEVGYLDK